MVFTDCQVSAATFISESISINRLWFSYCLINWHFRLRLAFDNDKIPDLSIINGDVHAVASLLKLFFRLLPDPLLTFALHDAFLESINDKENKLERIKNVIKMLPAQHRNTLSYLIKHLARVSQSSNKTAMNAKNC